MCHRIGIRGFEFLRQKIKPTSYSRKLTLYTSIPLLKWMRVHHLSWWFANLQFLTLDASPLLVTFNLHSISARSLKGGKDLWYKLDGEHYMHVLYYLINIYFLSEDILERVLVLPTFQVLYFWFVVAKNVENLLMLASSGYHLQPRFMISLTHIFWKHGSLWLPFLIIPASYRVPRKYLVYTW